jgi:hypothetical protein
VLPVVFRARAAVKWLTFVGAGAAAPEALGSGAAAGGA